MMPGTAVLLCLTLLSAGPADPVAPSTNTDSVVTCLRAEQALALQHNNLPLVREIEARIQQHCLKQQGRDRPQVLHNLVSADLGGESADRADGLIRTGTIGAFATDYQMDGTMWVASTGLVDSFIDIHRSTDHGATWQLLVHTTSLVLRLDRVGLVVGEGESAFVYLFLVANNQNGDLTAVRYTLDGTYAGEFGVLLGPETVNNLLVCRDYSGGNYWLYVITGDDDQSNELNEPVVRSVDYGKTWLVTDTFRFCLHGSLSCGAGSWLYCASEAGPLYPGLLIIGHNAFYGAPGGWRFVNIRPDTFPISEPVIAAAFTMPESTAVAWINYSHNYNSSGDWDVMSCYSTDGGVIWSAPTYLAGSSGALEDYSDLKNYTSLGNTYVNASYISEQGSDRRVYRHYANVGDPDLWSDSLRINENSAGTGHEVRPRLVYSPGASGTGAGCVFTGVGCQNLYWNAPWFVSVGEGPNTPSPRTAVLTVVPNPCLGRFVVRAAGGIRSVRVLDAAGRPVLGSAERGWNPATAIDLGPVPPGVYFVVVETDQARATASVVVDRSVMH
jgi:hypothetical protein